MKLAFALVITVVGLAVMLLALLVLLCCAPDAMAHWRLWLPGILVLTAAGGVALLFWWAAKVVWFDIWRGRKKT